MKKQKFLVLSEKYSYFCRRLVEEGRARGVQVDIAKYSDINYVIETGKVQVLIGKREVVREYDALICRSNKSKLGQRIVNSVGVLADLMVAAGKKVFNFRLNRVTNYKLYNLVLLAQAGVPVLPTRNYGSLEEVLQDSWTRKWPLVLKRAVGSRGEKVVLAKKRRDVLEYCCLEEVDKVLFQKYVPAAKERAEDMRIVCLGERVLGGFKRIAPEGQMVTNLCAGGTAVPLKITKELREICQKVCGVLQTDLAGIDIILDHGRPYVLEVNRGSHVRDFERINGINLAREIVDYLLAKKAVRRRD
jgi:ribosomal protein S6--L-glutamate ligase